MLNWVFLFLVVGATLTGAFTGSMKAVTDASIQSSKAAVDLAIGLVGQMALWLGVMHVLQEAGLMRALGRLMRPVMSRVFPDVPAEHPAMGAMIMNLAANMLGLANAATPFGIKAMIELDKLNRHKGVATNSMVLFLAINTSGVAVLPTGVIAVRASMGAQDATGIFLPSIIATFCSTVVAVIAAKLLQRLPFFRADKAAPVAEAEPAQVAEVKGLEEAEALAGATKPISWPRFAAAVAVGSLLLYALGDQIQNGPADQSGLEMVKTLSAEWILPLLMVTVLLVGFSKNVKVYEAVIAGAKQGFNVAVMIIPFLVAILVAIGMFRASGALDAIVRVIGPYTALIGLPAEALPMALVRPLSGSGALGVLMETMKTYGPDSYVGFLVSVINGSTETTFYVLAVYFGAVGVRSVRHAVWACLAADTTGVLMAVAVTRLFFT